MKNCMVNLVSFRKIYDLIWAWLDPNDPQVYCNLDIDGHSVLLTFTGKAFDKLDVEALYQIEKLFLQGCPLVDSDESTMVYHIGNTDYNFDCTTVDLIQFATDNGFVVDCDSQIVNDDDLITFIRHNRMFNLSVNEEGEVIIR